MQRQLEQYMSRGSGEPPTTVINTASTKDTTWKRQKGPLSDGPEGVTKTVKFYKSCDHVYWSSGYDVSKHHHNGSCKCKKNGHIHSHTVDNLAAGASIKDKEILKWA